MRWRGIIATVAFVAFASAPVRTLGVELITNGGFETGDFTGWTVTDQSGGSGSVFIDDADGFTPFSGHSTVGPAAGSFYAVTDMGGPGTHVLSQAFTVPANAATVTLTFNMFVNDWSGAGPIDQGLDYTLSPNQHARVDIMTAVAGAFDTGAGVLSNLFLGVDAGTDPNPYTPYVFDITAAVTGGGTFVVRFAEVDDLSYNNLGVDSVSIDATVCNSDGVIDPGEECDDGNASNGDGCSAGCRVEPCYICTGAPSSCTAQPDDTACDDGVFCNGADKCASAACTVHAGDPCAAGGECNNVCHEATDSCAVPVGTPCTDDGNVCTDNQCNGAGACVAINNFAFCDDGVFCNGQDECSGGDCSIHFGDPCLFTSECNNVCDESSGMCTPTTVGTPCSDDGMECTSDQCDGLGACAHPPVAGGTPCTDDGNACTNDKCDGAGACGHPPVMSGAPCPDDGNACTNDKCDGAGVCGHPPVMNGTPCDDSNACTQTDECQSGACVGSDPIVCAGVAPLCYAAGTCDPTVGTCTTCPAGYTQGNGGCQKTYAIDVSLLDNLASFCDGSGANRFNPCDSSAWGFHWTDTGDASVGAVTRLDIEVNSGVDCIAGDHTVSLNAMMVGTYPSNDDCLCFPTPTTQLVADLDTSGYVKGGPNAVSIDSLGSCAGVSQDGDGSYAIVTVTYQSPPLPLLIQASCRHGGKSKLKYKNSANDEKDKLKWKWGKGDQTTAAEFGDPTDTADYDLCIFRETSGDPTLLFGAQVPASATLWSATGTTGYKYNDAAGSQDGIKGILLRGGGDGKAKLLVKGKGGGLSDPTLPFAAGTTGIRAQLTNRSSGLCWESEFPGSKVSADDKSIKATAP